MDRLLIVIALLALVGIVLGIRLARRGRGTTLPSRVDAKRIGLDAAHGETAVVAFSGPYCHACQQWGAELDAAGIAYRKIDVLQEAGLARAHGVTHTPVVLVVDRADGRVLQGYDTAPDADSVERVRALVTA
jgi:hypothetical protein